MERRHRWGSPIINQHVGNTKKSSAWRRGTGSARSMGTRRKKIEQQPIYDAASGEYAGQSDAKASNGVARKNALNAQKVSEKSNANTNTDADDSNSGDVPPRTSARTTSPAVFAADYNADTADLDAARAACNGVTQRFLYVRDDLRSIVITGYPALWPPTLPGPHWSSLLGWDDADRAAGEQARPSYLAKLTPSLWQSIRKQLEAAWPKMDGTTRLRVSERLGDIEAYVEDVGWPQDQQ